jgi:hypothetical protein
VESREEIVIFLSEFDYQLQMIDQLYETIIKRKGMIDQEGASAELL